MPLIITLFLLFTSTPLQAQKQKLDASYDIGSELILLESSAPRLWYFNRTYYGNGYYAIYRNPKDNSYYCAHGDGTNLYVTNGLTYKLDMSKQETNYTTRETEYIYYVGSLSPSERLYIDIKNTNIQYIKRLVKIDDPFPVYPSSIYASSSDSDEHDYVRYTNAQKELFGRSPDGVLVMVEDGD